MAAAGLATTAYAIWEARQYTLRQVQVPVLPAGAEPVALLHISDLHLAARDTDRAAWVAGLADLSPDVVVATGDFLSAPEGLSLLRTGLGPLLSTPGAFVFGSNDYFSGKPINPAKYLRGPSRRPRRQPDLPTAELRDWLLAAGWLDLNNAGTATRFLAAAALLVRDLIGRSGFTQEHYDTLTQVWRTAIGPIHPDDAPIAGDPA